MKDLIVLVATIILGIFIALLVLNFRTDASKLNDSVSSRIDNMTSTFSAVTVPAIE